jgi:hypothetical protein
VVRYAPMGSRSRLLPLCLVLSLACRQRPEPPAPRPASPPPPAPAAQPTPSAPTLKRTGLTRADRKAWQQALGWPADCEEAFQGSAAVDAAGVSLDEISPGRSLVEVRCAWGAYQGSQVYYLYDETRQPAGALPLTFEIRESPDDRSLVRGETREVWGLPTFDPRTRELQVLNKFRGPGDCGTLATYRFSDGKARLAKLRAKVACDGQGAEAPEAWPEIPIAR